MAFVTCQYAGAPAIEPVFFSSLFAQIIQPYVMRTVMLIVNIF